MLAKQALYHFSHNSSPFVLWLFWRWGLWNYLPRLALNLGPPDSASQVARITGLNHQSLTDFIFYSQTEHINAQ
jgi:hypothetical protein